MVFGTLAQGSFLITSQSYMAMLRGNVLWGISGNKMGKEPDWISLDNNCPQ